MKTFRHILYVSLIICFGLSIPFMFNTDFGAGCGYSVFFLVVIVLYATDRNLWRKTTVFREKDINPVDIVEVTDDDEQYR